MRASWLIAFSGLSGRPGRSALLAIAVLLASSMVVAVACAVGSGRRSLEARLDRVIGATDARVVHENGNRFDDALLEELRTWPDVEAVGARLFSSVTVVREANASDALARAPQRVNVQVRGIDLSTMERFGQIDLLSGRLPRTDEEVLLDPLAVKTLNAAIGDLLSLQRFGPTMRFTVVGLYGRPKLGMLQRPEAVMSRAALANATGRHGEATVASLILRDELDVAEWCRANQSRLPPDLLLEPAEMITTGYARQTRASRVGFLLASIIAFLACSFIVATGMTTAVVDQQRLLAMTRCIGASRRQLFLSQLISGMLICGAGGALGVPLGIGLAWGLVRWLGDMLPEGLAIEPLGIALALCGAIASGIGGALYPAWRAARVSPLAALAARADAPSRRGLVMTCAVGAACISTQLLLLLLPDPQHRFWAYALAGLPLLNIGWFLLSVPALLLMSRVGAAIVARALGLPRALLSGSLAATPFRAGFTSGSLMVGVAILVSSWSNGVSLLEDWINRIRFADGFVFRVTGIAAEEQQRIAALPFVRQSCPIGYLPLRVLGEARLGVQGYAPPNVVCIGFDTRAFFEMTTLDWLDGSPESAIPALERGEGVLVAEQFLLARGLRTGDMIGLASGAREHQFRIVGVVSAAGLDIVTQWFGIRSAYMEHAISCVFADFSMVKRTFGSDEATMMQLALDPTVDDETVDAAIAQAVPGVLFNSGRAIRAIINDIGAALLAVSSAVGVGALLLGCFGVGNVIAAGIQARRQEFGVLRAVGAGRWLPARLVCGEAVLIALGGALSGTCLGMHTAWISVLLHRDLLGLPMRLVTPLLPIAGAWVTVVLLATLAALPAAWALARREPRELLG